MPDLIMHQAAIDALARDPQVRDALLAIADPVVHRARGDAPKATGRGAQSIHAVEIFDGDEWTVAIGWERERFYMIFHETGTRSLPERPFLVPALESA